MDIYSQELKICWTLSFYFDATCPKRVYLHCACHCSGNSWLFHRASVTPPAVLDVHLNRWDFFPLLSEQLCIDVKHAPAGHTGRTQVYTHYSAWSPTFYSLPAEHLPLLWTVSRKSSLNVGGRATLEWCSLRSGLSVKLPITNCHTDSKSESAPTTSCTFQIKIHPKTGFTFLLQCTSHLKNSEK